MYKHRNSNPAKSLSKGALHETSPQALAPSKEVKLMDTTNIISTKLPGKWLRVFPATAKEIFFLQAVAHQADKYAPAQGAGILVRPEVLA